MNSFGTLFKITLYGESHQEAIGVVIDGMPSGIKIDESVIQLDLKKRNPDAIGTTPRKETDLIHITSGVFNGYSTGSPMHLMIKNENVVSKDYDHLKLQPRPGHADFVANVKYKGYQDHRGGGRFSGRLTAPIVAAGAIAKMWLPFDFSHQLIQIGELKDMSKLDAYLTEIQEQGDSVGGIIEVCVKSLPVGLGEPMFEKLDAKIAQMLFSIPAVKGVSFGTGFEGSHLKGSQFNDLIIDEAGHTKTNHSGGVTGGISNGNDLIIKVFIKPTSSIKAKQETFDFKSHEVKSLEIGGRHDVAIARRAGIVLENAVAIVIADFYLIYKAYQ
jgi:chorismate synthase